MAFCQQRAGTDQIAADADLRTTYVRKHFFEIVFLAFLSFDVPATGYAGTGAIQHHVVSNVIAQDTASPALKKSRVIVVAGTSAGLWAVSFLALNSTWYENYSRSSFHLFNDLPEWNQMDKAGHGWTTYHISRISAEMWNWTGMPSKKSAILGGISGVAYQSIVEIQDGFSTEWGFSLSDMAANIAGAGAFVFQELGWKEQRIQLKLGYSPYKYPHELISRRNQLFGSGFSERILKDYNSQTYWVSANLKSFFPASRVPAWLNISAGYASDGMFGGRQNVWTDKLGNTINRTEIERVRRFYFAPDVDLTKIKTNHKLLSTVFYVLNMVKFPAPALELNSQGKLVVHGLKF